MKMLFIGYALVASFWIASSLFQFFTGHDFFDTFKSPKPTISVGSVAKDSIYAETARQAERAVKARQKLAILVRRARSAHYRPITKGTTIGSNYRNDRGPDYEPVPPSPLYENRPGVTGNFNNESGNGSPSGTIGPNDPGPGEPEMTGPVTATPHSLGIPGK